jgi:hypothetical protein
LTIVQVPAGETSLTVRLTDDANSWVYADAVRIGQITEPEVHVTVAGQSLATGQTLDFGQLLQNWPGGETISIVNAGSQALQVSGLELTGSTALNMTPIGVGDGSFASGEGFTLEVNVDTTVATGSYAATISFATNDADEAAYTIPLTVTITDGLLVDNGDPGFRVVSGNFLYASNKSQYVDGDVHYRRAGSGANVLEWSFSGLLPGVYDVSATWFAHSNRATNTPFTALTGGGALLATTTVNQELSPDDFTSQGANWEVILPQVEVVDEGDGTGSLVIRMSDDANEYVIADAVLVQYVGPGIPLRLADSEPTLPNYDLDGNGRIGYPDFSFFAASFGGIVGSASTPNAAAADFDGSGRVDHGDFSFFAANFGKIVGDGADLIYPHQETRSRRPVEGEATLTVTPPLTVDELAPVVEAAVARIEAAEGVDATRSFADVTFAIVDLPSNILGRSVGGSRIEIDVDAAGHGWFIDPTPMDDSEFTSLQPPASSLNVDLLSAVMHELGHTLGYGHVDEGVMQESLPLGTRLLWSDDEVLGLPSTDDASDPDAVDEAFKDLVRDA